MKNIIFAITLTVICFSCKKKETAVETPSPSTTSSTTNPTTTTYYGFFPLEKYCTWYNGVVSYPVNPYQCKVQLYSSPVSDYATWQAAHLGTVSINGKILQYTIINIYSDTTFSPYPDYSTQKNIVLTSTVLPSFTVSVTDTFPTYSSANALLVNDTAYLNSNFVIPLNNLNYHDKVQCTITTSPTTPSLIVSKVVNAGVNQIVFTPTDLSVFTSGQQLNCRLVLKKYSTQTFSNKSFRFECLGYNDFYMVAQ
ncbi:MAG: hypothetical protein JNJ41_07950 [Bacteroidia bacterium]|nr:hypothetical protein [Bacteroidia bacterium]